MTIVQHSSCCHLLARCSGHLHCRLLIVRALLLTGLLNLKGKQYVSPSPLASRWKRGAAVPILTFFGGGAFFLGAAWTAFLALAPFWAATCFVLAMMCKVVSSQPKKEICVTYGRPMQQPSASQICRTKSRSIMALALKPGSLPLYRPPPQSLKLCVA